MNYNPLCHIEILLEDPANGGANAVPRPDSRVSGAENEDERFCQKCGVEFVDSRIRRYQRKRFTTALLVNGFLTSQQSARLGISWILTSFQELHQPCLAIHQLDHYYTHSTYAFMERKKKGWMVDPHTNTTYDNKSKGKVDKMIQSDFLGILD